MGKYDDIIGLPRPVSKRHPPMPMQNRAAQFSPFAALTGYGASIDEAARLTERWIDLSDSEKQELGRKLGQFKPGDSIELTYFIPDRYKDGGRYGNETVTLKQLIPSERRLVLADGRSIDLDRVLDVEKVET